MKLSIGEMRNGIWTLSHNIETDEEELDEKHKKTLKLPFESNFKP